VRALPGYLHCHRHTRIGLLASKNVPVKIAQRFFGYADVSVTFVIMDAYSHVLRDMRTEIAKKIEEIFFWRGSITWTSKRSGTL
jgi:hypothetical protein